MAVGSGLLTMAALAQTQDRVGPRVARQAAEQQSNPNQIRVVNCFINMIDKRVIGSQRSGTLAFVKPEEGHEIKAEDIIARIRDEVAAAQFATAQKTATNDIEIRFGQKSADLAQLELLQSQKSNLLVAGTVSQLELARLKLAYERATLQIENAQKEHDVAGSKRDEAGEILQTHKIESPISGTVTKVYKRTGEAVREGDPIIEVVNTDRMRVYGYIPFAEVRRVRVGDKVKVNLDIPNVELPDEEESFDGVVTLVDPSVTKATNPEVKVYAEVVNRDGILRDGAGARMVLYPRKAAAGAPVNAAQRDVPRRPIGNE